MAATYTIGLDYGTNSCRAIVVRTSDGFEAGTAVYEYPHGDLGILLDPKDPNLARQHPADYLEGAEITVRQAMQQATEADPEFRPDAVVGIGVDTTGSTPLPVDADGRPLAFDPQFADSLSAMAWLWKDHTSTEEAIAITRTAAEMRPRYLGRCGNSYSSEWFWAKIWRCLKVDRAVFDAAYSWVEICDWIPAVLCGADHPSRLVRGICAAGHKAMYCDEWGGLPDEEFLNALDPALASLRSRLYDRAVPCDQQAGTLCAEWAETLKLREGIPVAVGAFDAHFGGIGAGIRPGWLVKIIGTSTCDMMVAPGDQPIADIPGLAGIVKGSILPGYWGLEAGQSAVGDIFLWYVNEIMPGGAEAGSHEALTAAAAQLRPGESGLLALDWNNGNRSVLGDQRLVGLLIGQTLHTTPAEIYRALVEATAFGALAIIDRFEEYGVGIEQVVNCGGIAEKNPMVMQIYADVTGRPMRISRSSQTCALGSAIAGAVVAGVYPDCETAQQHMSGLKDTIYTPDPAAHAVYKRLYALYQKLSNAFGTPGGGGDLYPVMKELIAIRTEQRA